MQLYAGIGSRETPQDILNLMRDVAIVLQLQGYTLRSGAAKGADTWFEKGAGIAKEIFTPKDQIPDWAYQTVYKYHPAPMRLSGYAKNCHARNAQILLGSDGKTPVDVVICWTKDGKDSGGTGQAIRIANDLGIPVFNLKNSDALQYTLNYIEEFRAQCQAK